MFSHFRLLYLYVAPTYKVCYNGPGVKNMRMCAIADLHGRLPVIPECDLLVVAGDLCPDFFYRSHDVGIMRSAQMSWLQADYAAWDQAVPAKHILVTPGNHDWIIGLPANCRSRFCIDEEVLVPFGEKLYRVYLTPWTSVFFNWNYMLGRDQMKARFADIPVGLDVLVTHGPAHKVLDLTTRGEHVGCPELRQAIYRAKPKVCVFGHIHEAAGAGKLGDTLMYNVAMFGKNWQPLVIEL